MGRILVADDHDSLRRGIVRALSDAHHEVDEAPNGNVAIEKLHEGQYDVVLSDLKMGGSDGLDVLRTAKSLHPTTAVILMTAFGSVHTAVEAMKIGAFDYVQKPFEIEEMELKVEKAIEHRRLQARDRIPPPHAAGHLRFRPHRRRERRAAIGAVDCQESREEQHDGAHPRRNGHRQGAHRRRDSPQLAARRPQLRQGQLRGAARRTCSSPSSSDTRRAPSRAPTSSASAASSRPTAARSSSTRSAT